MPNWQRHDHGKLSIKGLGQVRGYWRYPQPAADDPTDDTTHLHSLARR
jgi:hypothetical protein